MHLSAQASYQANAATVAAMLADREFVETKVRASGAVAQSIDIAGVSEGAFTVTTRRQVPTTDVPAQFRTLIGGTLEVREVQAWQEPTTNGRHGTIVVEVTGAPVRLTGTMRMTELGAASTTVVVEADLKASIPFFGGAVEKAISEAMHGAFGAEERAGAAWLAR